MNLSPACSASQHSTCPGYYKTAHPCECDCHHPARKGGVVATTPGNGLVVYDEAQRKEIMGLLGLEGSAAQVGLLFKLAERYNLDPLTKEIVLIPKKGPFIGVWGRLHIAQRSGKLDGLEMDDDYETDKHYCCRVVVWRSDMRHPAAKVIGRVAKTERKDWPVEIARARGLRAALGFAFSIHDLFDQGAEDDWVPAPDERMTASVVDAAAPEEVEGDTAAAPKTRRVSRSTGEVQTVPVSSERNPDVDAAPDVDEPPRTVIVGGHTLAQKLVIAAKAAGINDDATRHDVIKVASYGEYGRGTDIPEDGYDPDLVDRIFAAFAGIKDHTVELRYDPTGAPQLRRIGRT